MTPIVAHDGPQLSSAPVKLTFSKCVYVLQFANDLADDTTSFQPEGIDEAWKC